MFFVPLWPRSNFGSRKESAAPFHCLRLVISGPALAGGPPRKCSVRFVTARIEEGMPIDIIGSPLSENSQIIVPASLGGRGVVSLRGPLMCGWPFRQSVRTPIDNPLNPNHLPMHTVCRSMPPLCGTSAYSFSKYAACFAVSWAPLIASSS